MGVPGTPKSRVVGTAPARVQPTASRLLTEAVDQAWDGRARAGAGAAPSSAGARTHMADTGTDTRAFLLRRAHTCPECVFMAV